MMSLLVTDESSKHCFQKIVLEKISGNEVKQVDVKKESTADIKVKNDLACYLRKKLKSDKDDKVEDFENKELHLKEPKPKKNHNKKEKLSESEFYKRINLKNQQNL